MKFKFKLQTLMRQRKVEQDMAQRDYYEAQQILNNQLSLIKRMYADLDAAVKNGVSTQVGGGQCISDLVQIQEFIEGQKIRIQLARNKSREYMAIAEEKHEVLVERARAFKILEKLKERAFIEYRKAKLKKENKQIDDSTTMRAGRGD